MGAAARWQGRGGAEIRLPRAPPVRYRDGHADGGPNIIETWEIPITDRRIAGFAHNGGRPRPA